jgi:integrase
MTDKQRMGLRQIRALKSGKTIWDASLAGFGARRQHSNAVSYVLFYRTKEGRQRWYTIGRHGAPWTPDTARDEARRLLGEVAAGADPAADKQATRKAHTVSELCGMYLEDAEAGRLMTRRRKPKKASTLVTDRGRVERHIKPLIGAFKVSAVTRADIEQFMHDVAAGKTACRIKTAKSLANVRGGRGTASRTVGLLGAIFSYAVRHQMRPDNPVRGVMRPADGQRKRRLSNTEYEAFGAALRAAQAANIWPAAIAAGRFLALTGWRSGEALTLRWNAIDLARRTVTAELMGEPQSTGVVVELRKANA